jgi:hypothetical protein
MSRNRFMASGTFASTSCSTSGLAAARLGRMRGDGAALTRHQALSLPVAAGSASVVWMLLVLEA